MNQMIRTIGGLFPVAIAPQGRSVSEIALETGWWELDEIYKAYPGQFVVVTGKSGHGKSTFLFNLIAKLCERNDKRAFFYVPENERHVRRKLQRIVGNDELFKQLAHENFFLQSSSYEHYTQEPHTLDWVLNAAYNAMQLHGIDFIMIDPWNELERARPKDQQMVDYIGDCLRMARIFADETQTTVFIAVHPTKAANERNVTLGDCEGAQHWWNKCDNGLIIEREPSGRTAKIISAKVREWGAGRVGASYFTVNEQEQFIPQQGAVTP